MCKYLREIMRIHESDLCCSGLYLRINNYDIVTTCTTHLNMYSQYFNINQYQRLVFGKGGNVTTTESLNGKHSMNFIYVIIAAQNRVFLPTQLRVEKLPVKGVHHCYSRKLMPIKLNDRWTPFWALG